MQQAAAKVSYVESRDGAYWVTGTRVSLDSIVYAFWNGQAPESIAQSFPTLSLEEVYGATAYYLAHRDDVDQYLAKRRADFDQAREKGRKADPVFYVKLATIRHSSPSQ